MKIFHLSTDSRIGGCERLLIATQAQAVDAGVEHVFCTVLGRGPFHREVERLGGKAFSLGVRSRSQVFVAVPRLLALLREQRPDVLHTHLYHAGFLARVASHLGATPPLVYTRHYETAVHRYWGRWGPRVDRWATRGATRVVAISGAVRDALVASEGLAPDRVQVIHNGSVVPDVIPDRRAAGGGADLIAVGSLHPWKGHAHLIRALPLVRRAVPGVRLRILGEGKDRPALERLVEELGLRDVVALPGFVDDVAGALAAADLLVQPSLSEGFGIALLEGMAQELPVVASRVGGIPEVVEDGVTGLLVPPGDEEALASAVVGLLNDPARRRAFGRAGRARLERRFTLDAMFRAYASLYEELLATAPARGESRPLAPTAGLAGVDVNRL